MPEKDPEKRKEGNRRRAKAHYHRNRERLNEASKLKQRARLQPLYDLKETLWCVDCGPDVKWHHCQLDFDHLPGQEKVMGVAKMLGSGYSWDVVMTEIAKCEVVCANHHRLRTWQRQPHRDEMYLMQTPPMMPPAGPEAGGMPPEMPPPMM